MKSKRLKKHSFEIGDDGMLDITRKQVGFNSWWMVRECLLSPREAEALRQFLNESAEE